MSIMVVVVLVQKSLVFTVFVHGGVNRFLLLFLCGPKFIYFDGVNIFFWGEGGGSLLLVAPLTPSPPPKVAVKSILVGPKLKFFFTL